jgi:hypothetical protein
VEKQAISLETATTYILEECRMVLPGIQALFGFQLIAVFNQGFDEKLSSAERQLHLAALVLVTLAIALVMAPAALHRRVDPHSVSRRFIDLASGLLLAGMFPLALGLGIDVYLIANLITGSAPLAVMVALALLAVFALLWLWLPARERRRRE